MGVTRAGPRNRSRLTPPSGNIDKRTCVTGLAFRICDVNPMFLIGAKLLFSHQHRPTLAKFHQLLKRRGSLHCSRLQHRSIGIVAFEVRGIDQHFVDDPFDAKRQDYPVVPPAPAAEPSPIRRPY